MPLQLTFNKDDLISLVQKRDRLVSALLEKMTYSMVRLQEKIVGEKLSGQVLNKQSGRLASSIKALPAQLQGGEIVGTVIQDESIAPYGPTLEYGTSSFYEIYPGKKALKLIAEEISSKPVYAAHVTHPPFRARAYMHSALEESRAEIEAGLYQTVVEVMNE